MVGEEESERLKLIRALVVTRVESFGVILCDESQDSISRHVECLVSRATDDDVVMQAQAEIDLVLGGVKQSQMNVERLSLDCGLDIDAEDWALAYRMALNRVVRTEPWSRMALAGGGAGGAAMAAAAGYNATTMALCFAACSLAAVLAVCDRAWRVSRLCT